MSINPSSPGKKNQLNQIISTYTTPSNTLGNLKPHPTSSPNKSMISNDFISYISELEKKIDKKCIEFNSKAKEISSQINQMLSTYTQHKLNVEKIAELEHSYSKLNNKTTAHEIRIGQISKEVSDFCFKYDKLFKESFNFPGIIGPFCKYKSLNEFFNYLNEQIGCLIAFKDKTLLDLDLHQKKADNQFTQLNYKMENVTKNQIMACTKIVNETKTNFFENFEEVNQKMLDLHAEIINKTNNIRQELIKLVDKNEKNLTNLVIDLNKQNNPQNNLDNKQILNNTNSNIILVNNNTNNIKNVENLVEEIKNLKDQILSIKNTLDERNKENNSNNITHNNGKKLRNLSEKSVNHITNLSTLKNTKTKILLSSGNPLPLNQTRKLSGGVASNRKKLKASSSLSTEDFNKLSNSTFFKKKIKKNFSQSPFNPSPPNQIRHPTIPEKMENMIIKETMNNEDIFDETLVNSKANMDIKDIENKKNDNYEKFKCFTEYQENYKTKSMISLLKKSNTPVMEDNANDSSNLKSDCSSNSNSNQNNQSITKANTNQNTHSFSSNIKNKVNPIQVMQFANRDNIELLRFHSKNSNKSSNSLETIKKKENVREEGPIFGTVKVGKVLSNSISIKRRNNSKEKVPPIDCSPINKTIQIDTKKTK